MIYGSGVNYGNTDLPFTSHQTDNWPVSCCYDRRWRGGEGKGGWDKQHCRACLDVRMQANGSRLISDAACDPRGGVTNLALVVISRKPECLQSFALRPWSDKNAIKGGMWPFFFCFVLISQRNVTTIPSKICFFSTPSLFF